MIEPKHYDIGFSLYDVVRDLCIPFGPALGSISIYDQVFAFRDPDLAQPTEKHDPRQR